MNSKIEKRENGMKCLKKKRCSTRNPYKPMRLWRQKHIIECFQDFKLKKKEKITEDLLVKV